MKFSELLNKAGQSAEPNKERIRASAKRAAGGAHRMLAGLTAAVLLVGLIAGGVYTGYMNVPTASASDIPAELQEISPITQVRATETEGNAISTSTSFDVVTKKAMSGEQFRQAFAISPAESYTLTKKSGNTFTVSFENGLKGDTLYTVSSRAGDKTVFSWAFQTDNKFRITGHYPETGYFEPDVAVSVDFTHSNVEQFDRYFSIYPEVSGSFSHNGRRWAFIPDEPFEPDVAYTVTVSGDIKGGDGETLGSDYVFSFMCESYDSYLHLYYQGEGRSDCFLPDQTPAACISYKNTVLDTAQAEVCKVPSAEEFAKLLGQYTAYRFVSPMMEKLTESYDKVITFTADPTYASVDNYDENVILAYPQTFEKGYYVTKIEISGRTLYHLFEVSDLAVYSMSSAGTYVIWVNDTVSGGAVEGATAEVSGAGSAATGSDGVATVTGGTETDDVAVLTVKTQSGSSYVAAIGTTGKDDFFRASLDYYSYLYTDSDFYRPGDEVHVWGFVKARRSGVKIPHSVDIYDSWSDEPTSVAVKDGSFETTLTVSATTADNYGFIEVQSNGRRLDSRGFEIINYELPIYTIEATTDKNAYFEGEEIMYTVKVSHFDKTPAKNVTVHVSGYDSDFLIDTDENGVATFHETAVYHTYDDRGENNGASGIGMSFSITEPDGSSLYANKDVAVFGAALTAEEEYGENGTELSFYEVQLQGVNAQTVSTPYSLYELTEDHNNYHGQAVDLEAKVELHRVSFEKELIGEYYNPVTMRVERRYDYVQNDEVVSSGESRTENGKLTLAAPEAKEEGEGYYYYVYAEDEEGRTLCVRTSDVRYYGSYDFDATEYTLTADKDEYLEGDTIKLKLTRDEDGSEVKGGRFIVSGVNCDVLETKVFETPEAALTFNENYMPDAYVSAAYFDGRELHTAQLITVAGVSKELDIQILPDKQVYAPGDSVTLDVGVSYDGKSAPATVNVSVIDNAMFSLFYDYGNMYESVYSSRKYMSLLKRETSTYTTDRDEAIGEGGGGGGDEIRSDFTVTPLFKTVKTDASGHAKVTFKLPDTITSWHIIAQAFTDDVKVGSGSADIESTKDFYVYTAASDGIKPGDDAVFPIRFLAAEAKGQCQYTAELYRGDEAVATESDTAAVGDVITKNFGKLTAGEYTLRVTGKLGELRDVMVLPFTVKESTAAAPLLTRQKMDGQTAIEGKFTSDVTVNVYDEEYETYVSVTDDLLSHGERRLEQTIGRLIASAVRNGSGELSYDDLRELSAYATDEELKLFEGESYITLDSSAFVSAAAGKYFDKEMQASYFENRLEEGLTDTDALCAYWGLAALGRPVLNDLNTVKSGIAGLDDMQKLYLALAYAYAGDHANAREIYAVLKNGMMTANGVTEFSADAAYDTEYMTELAAMLAIKLHTPESKSLVKYVLGCEGLTAKRELVLAEFINDFLPYLSGSSTLTVTHGDGSSEKISFLKTECATVKIPYAELESVRLSADSGSIMTVSGNATVADAVAAYSPLGAELNVEFEQSGDGFAEVQVTAQLPDGYEGDPVLYVTLPYSFRIENAEAEDGCAFTTSQNKKSARIYAVEGHASVIFHCYTAAEGEFEMEPVYIIDSSAGAASVSSGMTFNVQ